MPDTMVRQDMHTQPDTERCHDQNVCKAPAAMKSPCPLPPPPRPTHASALRLV